MTTAFRWVTEASDAEEWARRIDAQSRREGDCLVWEGRLDYKGYGIFKFGAGRQTGAHRAAWLAKMGTIAEGLVIDHLCRNRACVDVLHMNVVTVQVNTDRGLAGQQPTPRPTHCKHGHEYTPETSRWRRHSRGYMQRTCKICERIRRGRP